MENKKAKKQKAKKQKAKSKKGTAPSVFRGTVPFFHIERNH
ncbi:hypothetical protein SAMN05444162_4191 [Paenibacillaceae bacterium GAS479]|nr:hypothetical protein SAMN05444162_4191 [Paenibacillaceae bacterium GAS479]